MGGSERVAPLPPLAAPTVGGYSGSSSRGGAAAPLPQIGELTAAVKDVLTPKQLAELWMETDLPPDAPAGSPAGICTLSTILNANRSVQKAASAAVGWAAPGPKP